MIAEAKLRGLAEALERDHAVRFQNGSQIEYEDCTKCKGAGWEKVFNGLDHDPRECQTCGGEKVRLRVMRPAGGVARYRLDGAGLRRAYEMALMGPPRIEQPTGDPAKFGDDLPW